MKAWEIAKKIVDEAPAVLAYETENDWTQNDLQSAENNSLRTMWHSKAPGSGAPASLIAGAVQSVYNMGRNVDRAEAFLKEGYEALEANDMIKLHRTTHELFTALNHAPKREESTYWNYDIYNTFEEFAAKCHFSKAEEVDLTSDAFKEVIRKSWLAQIAAGAFGTALEGYSREQILKSFGRARAYLKAPSLYNDDITYELVLLIAMLEKKDIPTSYEIAREWVSRIPFGWSAEDIALRNLRLGVMPPESGYLNNPYREWIGAQMRGAVCGYLAPGNPYAAAKLAWIDGEISHHNNGIIGEVFNAILTSLAFVRNGAREVLEETINMLPTTSEYYHVVKSTLDYCKKAENYEAALIWCEETFKEYNLVHAYPNAAIQVVALWFGQEDFDLVMEIGAVAGLDVDCNTAQLGAIIGALATCKVSDAWTEPLGEVLKTYVRGLETISMQEVVDMTVKCAQMTKEKL